FSSRRRHTRFSRDWSSDVCSSDLRVLVVPDIVETPDLLARQRRLLGLRHGLLSALRSLRRRPEAVPAPSGPVLLWYGNHGAAYEIGRASWRESGARQEVSVQNTET